MNKEDIEKIIAIETEGSMAGAAKKLYITQPALSKCLSRVEKELGEPLFLRRPSGLTPTYAGKCFIKKGSQIIKLYNDIEIEFCDLNEMRQGILTIGSANRVGSLVLPELLRQFQKQYPNISVRIIEENSQILEQQVIDGTLDMAFICLPIENENLMYYVFYEDPLYVAIPRESPLNQYAFLKEGVDRPLFDIQKLADQSFVLTKPVNKTRMAQDRVLKHIKGRYHIEMESKNIDTVMRFVVADMGVSIIPAIYAKIYDTGKEVNYYAIEKQYKANWQWAVIYSDYERLTRPSRVLLDMLMENGCQFPPYLKL